MSDGWKSWAVSEVRLLRTMMGMRDRFFRIIVFLCYSEVRWSQGVVWFDVFLVWD